MNSQIEESAVIPYADGEVNAIRPQTLNELMELSAVVARSGVVPRGMDQPEKVFVCIQSGMEAGLTPMQSLRSIYVVNGMPAWKGDAALALCRRDGVLVWLRHDFTGEGEQRACVVTSERKGGIIMPETSFSVEDAKRAGLWGKQGPWTQYPKRMMYYRAMGFHLRDFYGDVLYGMPIAEEAEDYPAAGPERPTFEPDVIDEPGPSQEQGQALAERLREQREQEQAQQAASEAAQTAPPASESEPPSEEPEQDEAPQAAPETEELDVMTPGASSGGMEGAKPKPKGKKKSSKKKAPAPPDASIDETPPAEEPVMAPGEGQKKAKHLIDLLALQQDCSKDVAEDRLRKWCKTLMGGAELEKLDVAQVNDVKRRIATGGISVSQ